jgi:hypothetical protein
MTPLADSAAMAPVHGNALHQGHPSAFCRLFGVAVLDRTTNLP